MRVVPLVGNFMPFIARTAVLVWDLLFVGFPACWRLAIPA
jgi:hypothetical protein